MEVTLPMPPGDCEKQTPAEVNANVGVVANATGQAALLDLAASTGTCTSKAAVQDGSSSTALQVATTSAPAPVQQVPGQAGTEPVGAGGCPQGKFQCTSEVKCIPMHRKCDAKKHCIGGEDEAACPNLGGQESGMGKDNFVVSLAFKDTVTPAQIASAVLNASAVIADDDFCVSLGVGNAMKAVAARKKANVTQNMRTHNFSVPDTNAAATCEDAALLGVALAIACLA